MYYYEIMGNADGANRFRTCNLTKPQSLASTEIFKGNTKEFKYLAQMNPLGGPIHKMKSYIPAAVAFIVVLKSSPYRLL